MELKYKSTKELIEECIKRLSELNDSENQNTNGDGFGNLPPRLLLKPKEYADLCGYCESFVYKKIRAGKIPTVRIGNTVRIPFVWVMNQIDEGLHAWEDPDDEY